jgi:hypothetical protein
MPILNSKTARRSFLQYLPGALLTLGTAARGRAAEVPLHVLKANDIQRLRLDFNASRSKVRLLFLLSPT